MAETAPFLKTPAKEAAAAPDKTFTWRRGSRGEVDQERAGVLTGGGTLEHRSVWRRET